MSLRIGAQIPATSTALPKTSDDRAEDKKAQADQSRSRRVSRAVDDAGSLAASDKMGELLKELPQSLADADAGLAPDETAASGVPADGDRLRRLEELASGALNVFASQTRILPADEARDLARVTAGQIQARSGQAVLGHGTMIPSSVLNLLH